MWTLLQKQGVKIKFRKRSQLPLPSSESCFSFRPCKSECLGSLSKADRGREAPAQLIPAPGSVLCTGGIREASACVAAIVYRETRRRLNNPPVNTAAQWETRKWQDLRLLHTRRSLDLEGSNS